MSEMDFREYLDVVEPRLAKRGFDQYAESPDAYSSETYHRRRLSLSMWGLVDTFCVLGSFADPAVREVESFSDRAFGFGLDHASLLPRGLGSKVVVIPVAVCRSASDNLKRQLTGYSPNHWGAYEFPVVVDLAEESVTYYTGNPLLGSRHYGRFRNLSNQALDPHEADEEMAQVKEELS